MGDEFEVKASIEEMKEFSAHGDFGDIAKFLICQDKKRIQQLFLVHGEPHVMRKLKEDLSEMGYSNIEIAKFGQSYQV
jgi:metallo-beta-lactamase family protein